MMISDVIDYAKLELGKLVYEEAEIDTVEHR